MTAWSRQQNSASAQFRSTVFYRWRWAFIIAGLPWIVHAVLLWRYAEKPAPPKPGGADRQRKLLWETLGHFRRSQSLMHTLTDICIVGLVLALVVGIGGAIGTYLSGVLADRYGDQSHVGG